MKFLIKFTLVLILEKLRDALVSGLTNGARRPALKAVENVMSRIQSEVISNCKEKEEDIQNTFDELIPCILRKQIGVTPKQEFLTNLEQCSKAVIAKTKDCLKNYQKYFPEFALSVAKSWIGFMYYDYKKLINDAEFARCVLKMMAPEAVRNYETCLNDISKEENESQVIRSKPKTCEYVMGIFYCFDDLMEKECEHSKDRDKFRQDLIDVIKKPCDL